MELARTIPDSRWETIENGIKAIAAPNSDFFVNPETDEVITSAPFFYREVSGDFVLRARVKHDFASTYDACTLLALDHERLWAKACFEMTDYGTHSVVSVTTNGRSDDANGVAVDGNEVWLQIARKGNVFGIHYSLDGVKFTMARLTWLPMRAAIKVGFGAQSPTGNGGERYFRDIEFRNVTLKDIRGGNE